MTSRQQEDVDFQRVGVPGREFRFQMDHSLVCIFQMRKQKPKQVTLDIYYLPGFLRHPQEERKNIRVNVKTSALCLTHCFASRN